MRKLNFNIFFKRAVELHGLKYEYHKVEYVNKRTKVVIVCPHHGDFLQMPLDHAVRGYGCNECAYIASGKTRQCNLGEFSSRAKLIHGDTYDYSEAHYTSAQAKLRIICPTHGAWEQTADSHLRGHGCQKCAGTFNGNKRRLTQDEFLAKCVERHGDIYDYSLVKYTGSTDKVLINCKKHGVFEQNADAHTRGNSCPGCYRSRSNFSRSAIEWLTYRSIVDNTNIQHAMNGGEHVILLSSGKRLRADGYSAANNQVYEYLGGYFHGDPRLYAADDVNQINKRRMGDLYRETVERRETIIALGYNYVEIWEADFLKLKKLGFIDAEPGTQH